MFVQPFDVEYPSNVLLAVSSSDCGRSGLRGNSGTKYGKCYL
jgi:hypothetical protein